MQNFPYHFHQRISAGSRNWCRIGIAEWCCWRLLHQLHGELAGGDRGSSFPEGRKYTHAKGQFVFSADDVGDEVAVARAIGGGIKSEDVKTISGGENIIAESTIENVVSIIASDRIGVDIASAIDSSSSTQD